MGHTVRDNPNPFLFFQQLSPCVNPNLTRTKANIYEARMLTALIHLCFAQFEEITQWLLLLLIQE